MNRIFSFTSSQSVSQKSLSAITPIVRPSLFPPRVRGRACVVRSFILSLRLLRLWLLWLWFRVSRTAISIPPPRMQPPLPPPPVETWWSPRTISVRLCGDAPSQPHRLVPPGSVVTITTTTTTSNSSFVSAALSPPPFLVAWERA